MRIKKLLILSGISFTLGCAGIPDQEVCDVIIMADKEICRCRIVSGKTARALTKPVDHPLQFCHGITGPRTKRLADEIMPHVKDEIRHCEDLQDQVDNYDDW